MSQPNRKHKRLEALFAQSSAAQPDPDQPQSNHEVHALKEQVAKLEAKLAAQPAVPEETSASAYMQHQPTQTELERASEGIGRRQQIALWVSKIFIMVGVIFLGFSVFVITVWQAGKADLNDQVLVPGIIVIALINLAIHRVISRGQIDRGVWWMYVANTIPLPILAVISTQDIYVLSSGYLILFTLLFISLVLPGGSTWKALLAGTCTVFVIVAIELWNPAFRVSGHHWGTFTPVVVALALLAALAFVVREAAVGNIRTKIITAFVVVTTLSMGIVAVLVQRSLSSSLTENIGTNLSELAGAKAIEIGQAVDRELDLLKSLALNSHVRAAAASANITNQLDEAELARRDALWVSAAKANNDTDPMVSKVLYNSTSSELRDFQQEFPQHVELFITNRDGINIAATDFTSDYYQADEEWWQVAYEDGLYIGQPAYDESTQTTAIPMAAAIHDEATGEIVGILRATVDFESLAESLIAARFGETGHTDIYLPTGQELTIESVEDGAFELVLEDAGLDINALVQSTGPYMEIEHDGVLGLASQSNVYVTGDTDDDTDVINKLGWRVISIQDKAEALEPVNDQTRSLIVVVVLITILAVFAAIILARMIAYPIIHLKTVAEKVAAGDLTVQASVETRDELGTLASAFNNMTSQLRSLFGSLEQRVQDRTHDLELASEVGRTITEKVDNLNEMLMGAAEMIRSRFNLYYTQVYLMDPAGRRLILRAGTGAVGEQLIRQAHYLLVDSNSLNGRTVIDRKPIIVADTVNSANFRPNPLLPETRSEMTVPLVVGDRVIGVLDMQSDQPGALSETNLPAFEALAGQLAVALQNASLFARAEEAHHEVQAQIRQMTGQGWQDFLNAIDRGQKMGYAFDHTQMLALTGEALQTIPVNTALSVPLQLSGMELGVIQLTNEPDHSWESKDVEVTHAIATRLAQHIDNLRLLAQAELYRAEAEQAVRRLTREGWDSYLQNASVEAAGFEYDLNEVQPLQKLEMEQAKADISQPLTVRNELIGQLYVNGNDTDPDDAQDIISAVAAQLSDHIENLRLFEQSQSALATTQKSEAKLSEALNIAKLANWEYDVEKDLFSFNDHFYSIFHTNVQEVGSYKISSAEYAQRFVHPDDIPVVGKEIEKALNSTIRHYSAKLEHRVIFADGGVGHVSVEIHIDRDEDGKIIRYYGANQDITERKKAELAIQESEAKLSEALQIARLANWEYDFENDQFIFNDHFYSIFHTTAEKVGGYKLSSAQYAELFVHPDDAALVGAEIGKAIASTEQHFSTKLEHRVIYANGSVGYISVDVHVERDENGQILRWYGANQDITERKKAEEVIRLAQERAQVILETVTLPMVITRISDNVLTFINQPATEVARVKYEDAINRPAPDFYYNLEDRSKFIAELREHGRVFDLVVQLKRAGEPFWALVSARLFNYQNEPSILTTFMDITDRVNAEEAVARRAAELQTVAEVSTTTATTLEPDYLLQSVVDLTKERFGLYHAHIYLADDAWETLLLAAGAGEVGRKMVTDGWNIPMAHTSSIVAEAARTRKSVIANDVYRDQESGFLSNKLLPETRSEMAVPMIAGDKVLGVFDVQSDEAGKFTAEDANLYTTLAAQVAVALQNARLYVEQAATVTQLRELDRLKSAFLANMSHELRTPLNSILGFADVMLEELDGPLTDYMNNDLRLIQKNGQHLLHLINDVLDMAKIEAGRMNLNPEQFRVYEVLEEVTSITSSLASDKNLALSIEESSDHETEIYADRTRIRQVMINLVNNSIKFTENGHIAVKVESMDGGRVLISVKDTGIGIPPDKLDAVFLEFTQVDTSTTRKAGGTGLGLPISRRLVEMHGGRLWAESTGVNGEGSTFYVELPVEARITDVIEKQAN